MRVRVQGRSPRISRCRRLDEANAFVSEGSCQRPKGGDWSRAGKDAGTEFWEKVGERHK